MQHRAALKKSGFTPSEFGVFEVNEACAPVPLAWLAEIGTDPALLNRTAVRSPSATRSAAAVAA